jgi:hypothetical protein
MDRSQSATLTDGDRQRNASDLTRAVYERQLEEMFEQERQLEQARNDFDDYSPAFGQFVAELRARRSELQAELSRLPSPRRPAASQDRLSDRTSDRWTLRNRVRNYRPSRRGDAWMPDDLMFPTIGSDTDATNYDGTPLAEDLRLPAAFLYSIEPALTGSDVWPDMRDPAKVPARYTPIEAPFGFANKLNGRAVPSNRQRSPQDEVPAPTWPMGELPSEIYYLITDHLSRDDVKAMRLTCQEFERHISCVLFRTVVVPFNTEIYGMLRGTINTKADVKGKGKMKVADVVGFWKNSKADDIYTGYGIDVFRSFGPRMKKFGMSFEVDEDALANPPLKGTRQAHKSYWGEYSWPYPEYQRFEQVAGLEDAADETPKMKVAFSLLGEVQELALSLDSGLGWISGPDQSLRSRIMRRPHPVFDTKHNIPERKIQAQRELWRHLKTCCVEDISCDLRHSALFHRQMSQTREDYAALEKRFVRSAISPDMPYIDLHPLVDPTITDFGSHPSFIASRHTPDTPVERSDPMLMDNHVDGFSLRSGFVGGVMVVKEDVSDHERFDQYPIIPNSLSKLQKEWLLETEWAQRAFLSSYLVAIVDSRVTFQNVHTLNFARISSRFLHSLGRNDFWNALPNVNTVNLQVIADWRDVTKDNAGFVDTPRVSLAAATFSFQKLLVDMVAPRRGIKTLSIGWACGGENAQGLHARNRHLMPAPFLPQEWLASVDSMLNHQLLEHQLIEFRHVEDLTIKNCWMPPNALISLVKRHDGLTKLTLDSVSLTAPLIQNAGINPHQQHFAAQMGMPMAPIPAQALPQTHQHGQAAQNAQPVIGGLGNLLLPHHAFYVPPPNGPPAHVAPHPGPTPNPTSNNWIGPHRAGSWPDILDTISPGATLASHGSTSSPTNIVISNQNAKLKNLTVNSCGYACLHNPRFDESAIQMPAFGGGSAWFTKRFAALAKVMMMTKSLLTAEIVQHMPPTEMEALEMGWDCRIGWPPLLGALEEEIDAEASVYDGCLPGGTGRFSGRVTIESRAPPTDDI